MIVNSSISSKMACIFISNLRQHQRLSFVTKHFINKRFYHNCKKYTSNQKQSHVTSVGINSHSIFYTNNTNIISRKMSGENQNLTVNYDDIVKAQGNDSILIIDVREDSEIQETGKLPGSIHIPMGDVTNIMLTLSNEEFEKKYNRKKPTLNSNIILSCRSGRRSAVVQSELQTLGYKKAYNYEGGWLDWESKQKL